MLLLLLLVLVLVESLTKFDTIPFSSSFDRNKRLGVRVKLVVVAVVAALLLLEDNDATDVIAIAPSVRVEDRFFDDRVSIVE